MADLVTLDDIRDAATLIAPYAVRTPLLAAPWPGLWIKAENLQPIGAFKIRGAVTAMSRLAPGVRDRGVLAHSSGNHAQAVAYAARAFGIDAHIVIPDNAPARKVQATRDLGATVELVPVEQRFSRPLELAEQTGKPLIPPFDHPDVISGQGTVGLEIAQDAPDVDTVLVPVSGGGLISGIAAAITALIPSAKVVGVEPELAGDAAESFRAGRRIPWTPAQTARTMADGLRTFSVGELPWAHISTQVHDIVTVTEDEIADATRRLLLEARLVAEPSGAVAAAAFLHHPDALPGGKTVAVLSGGNIDPAVLVACFPGAGPQPPPRPPSPRSGPTHHRGASAVSGSPTELVRVYRSGFHEGSHFGSVVITDRDGSVLHARGDVTSPMFPRSSSKPFQSVAMLSSGADLAGADLALASASHSGEPMHVDRALAVLARAGVQESDLRCPPALPMNEAARLAVLEAGRSGAGGVPAETLARRIYMNCSGKHAGMLTACRVRDWPIADYVSPDHPLQRRVAEEITRLTGEKPSAVGVDGCGAPLFAISLLALARGFGAVTAAPEGTPERAVADAMRAHPEMVGGTGREDTRLMQALPGLLVKGGAEGVHCAALPDGRCVAVKIADGGDRARMPVLIGGLRSLGIPTDSAADALLDELGIGAVLGGGVPVGTVELAAGVF